MTFEQLYRILKARWILAASVFLGIITLAVVLSLALPKSYKATASVMVDLKPDPVSGMSQLATMQPANYLATQVDIIKSDHVAQRVVRILGLNNSEETRKQWQEEAKGRGSFDAWLGEVLQKGLEVEPSRDSNIIEIHYKSPNPAFATALANAFSRAYVESLVQIKVDPARRYSDFFEERAKLARDKLEKAQMRLAEAQKQSGILITDERLDAETTRLNEMGAQLVGIRALVAEANGRGAVASRRATDQTPHGRQRPSVPSVRRVHRQAAHGQPVGGVYRQRRPYGRADAIDDTRDEVLGVHLRPARRRRRHGPAPANLRSGERTSVRRTSRHRVDLCACRRWRDRAGTVADHRPCPVPCGVLLRWQRGARDLRAGRCGT